MPIKFTLYFAVTYVVYRRKLLAITTLLSRQFPMNGPQGTIELAFVRHNSIILLQALNYSVELHTVLK